MPLYRSPEPGTPPGGATAQVLAKASGADFDTDWVDQSGGGGGVAVVTPQVGQWAGPAHFANTAGGGIGASASGFARGAPIYVSGYEVDRLSIRVQTSEAVNALLLLYSSNADNLPGTLVASASVSCSSGGAKEGTFTPINLPAGLYWAFVRTDGGSAVRFQGARSFTFPAVVATGSNQAMTGHGIGSDVGTYASPTATLTAWEGFGDEVPWIMLRRSA